MNKENKFQSLFATTIRACAKTISNDIFASQDEIDSVKNRIIQENRDGKIDYIIEGKEFEEKKIEDDSDYKELINKGVKPMPAPSNNLFYFDFVYGK